MSTPYLELTDIAKQLGIARYMTLPPKEKQDKVLFILQHHWRGKSVHWDFRFKLNEHLEGWSFLDNPKTDKPPTNESEARHLAQTLDWTLKPIAGMEGKKMRVVTKAKQPVEWLKVEGRILPGEVGAAIKEFGYFYIADQGILTFGAQKPYFHEYFLQGNKFKNLRLVIRGIRLPRLDPETKQPLKGKYDIVWTAWLPEDQDPYAVSNRAKRENWKPPQDYIPIPQYWIKTHPREYDEWQSWVKGAVKKAPAHYSLAEHKWMRRGVTGEPIGIRKIPRKQWFLRFQMNSHLREFQMDMNPLWESPIMTVDNGTVSPKWLNWEGQLKPGQDYNFHKDLISEMTIMTSGSINVETSKEAGEERLYLTFKSGRLRGKWLLNQEEPKAEIYTFSHSLQKAQYRFVLDRHEVPAESGNWHCDIRVDRGTYLDEWNIPPPCPATWQIEQEAKVNRKRCYDSTWMNIDGNRRVGPMMTRVDNIDHGVVDIIHETEDFTSMRFHGDNDKLKGYYTLIKRNDEWFFQRSALPITKAEPPPLTPPQIQSKVDTWVLHLRDRRHFSSCTSDTAKYDPPQPPADVDLNICFYPRPGALPGALIQSLTFPKQQYTKEDVEQFNVETLKRWHSTQIRG